MTATHETPVPVFRRLLAVGAAALVLFLGVLAASPSLHASLHGDHGDNPEADGCAVVLFAGGVTMLPAAIAVPLPSVATCADVRAIAAEIFLVTPRYLRQPERGPPSLG